MTLIIQHNQWMSQFKSQNQALPIIKHSNCFDCDAKTASAVAEYEITNQDEMANVNFKKN